MLRRVLHLILLLLVFGVLIGVLRSCVPRVPEQGALVIAPEGPLVEQLSGEPAASARSTRPAATSARETLLWDLTRLDSRGRQRHAHPGAGARPGQVRRAPRQPALEELAAAHPRVPRQRQEGHRLRRELTQERYYLAAQADEIYLDPMGFVLLEGYDRYRMYFKDALDKLGVDINVFRVGAFKSAVETFTRTSMSPEDREESRAYLQRAVEQLPGRRSTRARKLPPGCARRSTSTRFAADACRRPAAMRRSVALQRRAWSRA